MNFKAMLQTGLAVIVTMAIVNRVEPLRQIVGS